MMPSNTIILDPKLFDKNILLERQRKKIGLEGYAAANVGMSCNEVK